MPEYRLSLQLKIYESVKKQKFQEAHHFLRLHKWIQQNVRNILDESDAILHPKYQLIYTVGNQMPLDGGSQRWHVHQAVMKRIPYHMARLYGAHGEHKIEFDAKCLADGKLGRDDVFAPCRLLDADMFQHLRDALIDDFVEGRINFAFPEMLVSMKTNMRTLLSYKQINKNTFESMLSSFSDQEQKSFMVLSGLLRFEVLRLVLTKRWRVNYGVNTKGPRKMAVPFKAKDVAAEMTEFGHPDVAICFTLLSYYYSGGCFGPVSFFFYQFDWFRL